ncbi:MAG TPA: polysaccharide deacetylase family protein, partial [Rhizomicrobium sp.]
MSLARFNRLLSRHAAVKSAALTAGRPIASITFDDFPKSAWSEGGPVLARHGVRATYYTSGSFC